MSNWEKTMKEWDDSVPDGIKYLSAEKQVLMRRVRELESENARLKDAQRWIPVSERLPEVGKVVHVIDMNFIEYFTKPELVYETAVLVEVNGFKMFGFVNEFSAWSSSDVTHWMYAMPLPTPPEVQE